MAFRSHARLRQSKICRARLFGSAASAISTPSCPQRQLYIALRLKDAPELEAKTIFDYLIEEYPDQYKPDQLRTLQRRITEWRAKEGPEQELFFPREHLPGEAMQTDFT